ncbi:alpha/beta fold hydrolase [Curtobacterium sp. USHLN213]|uniref:alpha/beta fold hydrolase n=1 Tax=Curtobacterium sp. USHLN213 TaxID=3081255 RepID=UPI00301834B9
MIGGAVSWPLQHEIADRREVTFLTRPGYGEGERPVPTDFAAEAQLVLDAAGDGAHVVSQSFGFASAMQAAAKSPESVLSLTLMEPAAFSLARGVPAIEAHIAAVDAVQARHELSLEDFFVEIAAAVGVPDVPLPLTPDLILLAERWRLQPSPWYAELDPAVPAKVPTTVVTGNWSEQYEAIAAALVALGAEHRHILGFGHSVPRSPEATPMLEAIFAQYDRVAA